MTSTAPGTATASNLFMTLIITAAFLCIANSEDADTVTLDANENALPAGTQPRQYPTGFGGGYGGTGVGGYGGLAGGYGGPAGGYGGPVGGYGSAIGGPVGGGGCPLCDSSVYSYCSYKMLHDSCCCDFPAMHLKPQHCYYNDCSLLYAKTCHEYGLIKNCCCNNPY